MKKKYVLLFLCVALTLGIMGSAGCGKGDATPEQSGSEEPADQTYRVALFFANEEYISTGDESLEKFMVYETEITTKPESAYKEALELLKTSPEEGYSTVITDRIKINDVYLEGDTAFVDLASSGLNGGSLEESFLIGQIVNTMTNSFDEVKQVQFLVDGDVAETLMGHIGAEEPFTKDLFAEQ